MTLTYFLRKPDTDYFHFILTEFQDSNWLWLLLRAEHKEIAFRFKISGSHLGKQWVWKESNWSQVRRNQQRIEDHPWPSLEPGVLWHTSNWVQCLFHLHRTPGWLSNDEEEKPQDPAGTRALHWNLWHQSDSKRHPNTSAGDETVLLPWRRRLPIPHCLLTLHCRQLSAWVSHERSRGGSWMCPLVLTSGQSIQTLDIC